MLLKLGYIVFPPSSLKAPSEAVSLGAIAFLVAGLSIAVSIRNSQSTAASDR
ncbi:hypothetical protein [Microcoleus sp. LEGE 07076]|uniref:hypothetical protein n=1 Tax=Microcoleus sp. LEGE 07076 TaxID=915322 RepID=UPI001881D36E|nr:hypothetical protein [Microcoleus sp. LEGE 07076]